MDQSVLEKVIIDELYANEDKTTELRQREKVMIEDALWSLTVREKDIYILLTRNY